MTSPQRITLKDEDLNKVEMIWLKATVAFVKKSHYASHFAVGDMPVSLDMERRHTPELTGLNLKLAAKRWAQTTDLAPFQAMGHLRPQKMKLDSPSDPNCYHMEGGTYRG